MDANELGGLLLEVLPPDGSTLGNLQARLNQGLRTTADHTTTEALCLAS